MNEWIIRLDPDLQVTEVVQIRPGGDSDNGPLGIMFSPHSEGCVYDAWSATIETDWKPRNRECTWAYERARPRSNAAEPYQFYTNAVDELGAFNNLQAWLKEQEQEQPPAP